MSLIVCLCLRVSAADETFTIVVEPKCTATISEAGDVRIDVRYCFTKNVFLFVLLQICIGVVV